MRRQVIHRVLGPGLVVLFAACSSSAEPGGDDTFDSGVGDVATEVSGGDVALDSTAQSDTVLEHDVAEHEVVERDGAEPEVDEPDVVEHEVDEPDVVEPDVEPDVAEPDVVEPDVEPDVAEPDVVDVVEHDVAEPDVSLCPANCDDGNACNGIETCDPGTGCVAGTPLSCNDGNACNGVETCHATNGCVAGTPLSCNDGNACNGVETCHTTNGCRPGTPLDCDDGNACNGDETCQPAVGCVDEAIPACPTAPPECDQVGGVGTVTSGRVTAADERPIRLVDDDTWDAMSDIVDLLEAQATVTPVTLDDVLANLNRVGSRVSSVPDVECFHVGFEWNDGDGDVDYWYPQGLTGTADAYASGAWNGKKVLLSSWYHKPEEEGVAYDKGVRVGFVDVTDLDDITYRWALLVVPKMQGGQPTFERLPVHAGGLTWYRNYLYVPDTSRGFRVFDMSRILQVQTGRSDLIGRHADGYHAHDYRYVIPQVGSYSLCPDGCCARFSYASLDTTTDPISIVSGEYSADSRAGRLHRWPLDATTGRLVVERGRVQAMDLYFSGVTKVQGGLTWDDRFFLSCSGSDHPLRTGLLGAVLATRDWAYGPEDLHYAPASDNLWTVTEHPGSRYVFAVKKADMTAGCP